MLLVIPPFYQPNALYPSVSQLNGFLRHHNFQSDIDDLSLKVLLRIFSKEGLKKIFDHAHLNSTAHSSEYIDRIVSLQDHYIRIIDSVISFLQGKNPQLAHRIVHTPFIPASPIFEEIPDESGYFGELGIQDHAKYLCSLVIDELTRFIQQTVSNDFGLSRYAEHISLSPPTFDELYDRIQKSDDIIFQFIREETITLLQKHQPDVIGYSIPFPGNLLGTFLSARVVKETNPNITIIAGGGFPNTELRQLTDPRVFDFLDFLCLDDGEMPLLHILNYLQKPKSTPVLVRTFLKDSSGRVVFIDNSEQSVVPFDVHPGPDIGTLDISNYFSVTESLNPMHRLWSDGFWNKITLAHGCYWHRCTFCDTTLDYIKRYHPARASTIVDWMEHLIEQTGVNGFHFVDEAAPPALLKEVSLEILKREMNVTWWGNIRFEKAFTADLARLMAEAGCIAVTGGLEVAHPRLLTLINKGVSVSQVANVAANFHRAGILVHAYLMYGFPTQTEQELIDSLEMVRQLFELDIIQSGFWHRFALTAHSPVGKNPGRYNLKITSSLQNPFATNDLLYEDSNHVPYEKYSSGLIKALYNYMHQNGLDWKVQRWFDFPVPAPQVSKKFILNHLREGNGDKPIRENARSVWLNALPRLKRKTGEKVQVECHFLHGEAEWDLPEKVAQWLIDNLNHSTPATEKGITFSEWEKSFPGSREEFKAFLDSDTWTELRDTGLLFV